MAGKDNLKPIVTLSTEEAKQRGSKGGKASVKARREKKLMSEIYAEFLQKEHNVLHRDGTQKKLTGQALLNSVMSKVLSRGDGSSVRLMKEVREATEGTKHTVDANITVDIDAKKQELKDRLTRIATDRTTTS